MSLPESRRPIALVHVWAFALWTVLGSACGVVSPTPMLPSLAGNYVGAANVTFMQTNATVRCSVATTVTTVNQSEGIARIDSFPLTRECGGVTLPMGQIQIAASGQIGTGLTGTANQQPGCGTFAYRGSGAFVGRELRLVIEVTSETCANFNFAAVLNR